MSNIIDYVMCLCELISLRYRWYRRIVSRASVVKIGTSILIQYCRYRNQGKTAAIPKWWYFTIKDDFYCYNIVSINRKFLKKMPRTNERWLNRFSRVYMRIDIDTISSISKQNMHNSVVKWQTWQYAKKCLHNYGV